MPTILRVFGLRFFFHSNDHLPIHVHVQNADGEAKFNVEHVECVENKGLKSKDVKLAESLIQENKDILIEAWNNFFKQ
ncbi:MAG: DUF4160 domain-containing protein [Ekhidna sp.]|nr:DUF4160 domain-containing protein [Ekhidna sp.]